MSSHPIVDKALEEGWPLTDLIDVCELFGYEIHITERGEMSPNEDKQPGSGRDLHRLNEEKEQNNDQDA